MQSKPEASLEFRSDCDDCQGLCCIAFRLTRGEMFPVNKNPGLICENYCSQVGCVIWEEREAEGWKGCVEYDCGGLGNWLSDIYKRLFSFDRRQPGRGDSIENARAYAMDMLMDELHDEFWRISEVLKRIRSPHSVVAKGKDFEAFFVEIGQNFANEIVPLIKEADGRYAPRLSLVIGEFQRRAAMGLAAFYKMNGEEEVV